MALFGKNTNTTASVEDIPRMIVEMKYSDLQKIAARFKEATNNVHKRACDLEPHDWAQLIHVISEQWIKDMEAPSSPSNPGLLVEHDSKTT